MKISKTGVIGILLVLGIVVLVMMTYIIPLFFLKFPSLNNRSVNNINPTPLAGTPVSAPDEGPVIVIRPFQRFDTSEGQAKLEIKAAEATIDQKSRIFHLTDIQRITFFGDEDQKVTVKADKGSWHEKTNKVRVEENVEVLLESPGQDPVSIVCQWLEYDNDQGTLTGGDRVSIRQQMYEATGDKLRIKPHIQHLDLSDNVVAIIKAEVLGKQDIITESIQIDCDMLQYNGQAKILEFLGSPRVTSGLNVMTSKKISVFMDTGNTRITWSEQCKFKVFSNKEENVPIELTAREITVDRKAGTLKMIHEARIEKEEMSISASDSLIVNLDPDTEEILGGTAHGNVRFVGEDFVGSADAVSWDAKNNVVILNQNAHLENQKDIQIDARHIQLHLEQKYYIAKNDVRLEMKGLAASDTPSTIPDEKNGLFHRLTKSSTPDEPLILLTESLAVDENSGEMLFSEGVRGTRGVSRFTADTMTVLFDPITRQILELSAKGAVSLSEEDRLLTANSLRYSAITGDIEAHDNPVIWQGESQIRADRFIYNEIDQLLKMSGNVDAVTRMDDSDNPLVYLTSGNATYDEVSGNIHFQDNVVMKKDVWTIRSDSLHLTIDPETGEMNGANALGNVQIQHPLFDSKGHSLTYNPETSILVLRGTKSQKCIVTQGERGSQGDEIRFFVNENRFVVEKGLSMIMPSEATENLK